MKRDKISSPPHITIILNVVVIIITITTTITTTPATSATTTVFILGNISSGLLLGRLKRSRSSSLQYTLLSLPPFQQKGIINDQDQITTK